MSRWASSATWRGSIIGTAGPSVTSTGSPWPTATASGTSAAVEVEVAVDVGQARGPRVGRPERGGDARDERAAAAEDREGPAADERRDAVADAFAGRDDGRVANDPALGIALRPHDAHVEIAAVARAEDLHDPLVAEGRGREHGAAGLSERVDRDTDHGDVSPAHVAPRTPPTNARAGSVTLSQ